MPGKPITHESLMRDGEYTIGGTLYHTFFGRVQLPQAGLRILEPGCGSAKFALAYALHGCAATALDIDPGVIQYAKALAESVRIHAKAPMPLRVVPEPAVEPFTVSLGVGDVHTLSERFKEQDPFDFVYWEGLSHHWPPEDKRRQTCFDECVKVLKSGGKAAFMVSNAHCMAMLEYAEQVKHTYEGMPQHQIPLTMTELFTRCVAAGLTDVKVLPVESDHIPEARTIMAWGVKL